MLIQSVYNIFEISFRRELEVSAERSHLRNKTNTEKEGKELLVGHWVEVFSLSNNPA